MRKIHLVLLRKTIFWIFTGLSCFALYMIASLSHQHQMQERKKILLPPLVNISPEINKILTLGHEGAYHTFLNLWSVQYFSDHKDVDLNKLVTTMSKVVGQKIRFESFYLLSCYFWGLDQDKPENCKNFTDIGLNLNKDSWRLPMTQGFVSQMKMKRLDEAAFYYSIAASREDTPEYVPKLAKRLIKTGSLDPSSFLKVYGSEAIEKQGPIFLKFLQQMTADAQREIEAGDTGVRDQDKTTDQQIEKQEN